MPRTIVPSWVLLSLGFVTACTGEVQTYVVQDLDMQRYRTAYVNFLMQDEFNLGSAIATHLGEMGLQTKAAPAPSTPSASDMLVRYDYYDGWDLTKYLKSFSIQFFDATSGTMLVNSRYNLVGKWRSDEFRIRYTFNDIRLKLGYPPLKDFTENP